MNCKYNYSCYYNYVLTIIFGILQVNEQFAINLLAEEPVVVIKGTHTWCDGGKGALGHPKVYINLDKPEINDCGYCGKRFVAEASKEHFKAETLIYE